jgi:hypothetical protein
MPFTMLSLPTYNKYIAGEPEVSLFLFQISLKVDGIIIQNSFILHKTQSEQIKLKKRIVTALTVTTVDFSSPK